MRTAITLLASLLYLFGYPQDISGIWRGNFIASDNKLMDMFNMEERYKYEVQIDQHSKAFNGVTYSYKTTVFYGKASANGTFNPKTGKVLLQEIKLLELKMSPDSYACWMICFLQYSKNGDEEFLEGRYSSYRETDSAACGRGTVFLRKVVTSDFYKEPFLARRERQKTDHKILAQPNNSSSSIVPKNEDKALVKPPATLKPPLAKTTTVPLSKNHSAKKENPSMLRASSAPLDPKGVPLVSKIEMEKREPSVKAKDPSSIPLVLKNRENEVVQYIIVNTNEITLNIYDNGTIDHDTVSVYLDKKLVVSRQMLRTVPIVVTFRMDENSDYHEVVMVAENLGDIPPNTSLMVVKAGDKQYEVRIASTEQKNAVVIFKYEKPK